MTREDYNIQALRAGRIAAGFRTQAQAAERLGIDYRTVSRIETGRAAGFDNIKKMCLLYNISLHSIIYDTPVKKFR